MPASALAAPILPGKTNEWKTFAKDLTEGSRKNDFIAFTKRCGVSHSRCWLQHAPQGDIVIVLHEGATPDQFHRQVGTSSEPFAQWFRGKVKEFHGIDLSQPLPPEPQLMLNVHPG